MPPSWNIQIKCRHLGIFKLNAAILENLNQIPQTILKRLKLKLFTGMGARCALKA